ncbi:hypothetical protein J1N35_001265 [Gossypium stocksii]|uniref:Chromatin target of PRMT1 protein C-terminal domain-containing protein n=1 Tax=Gossypium stocksii TaxID=47602 RepID=A0A9D4AKW0_9ROSI|nr:hypothetical protein J1N35_001265 [Gossypium stocksii]
MVQKQKRAKIVERKRLIHGDPATKKLKNKSQSLTVSGKRECKLLKKWRRSHIMELLTGKLPYEYLTPLQTAVGVVQKEMMVKINVRRNIQKDFCLPLEEATIKVKDQDMAGPFPLFSSTLDLEKIGVRRGWIRGGVSHRFGRGRGHEHERDGPIGKKLSAEDLDADLDKYHLEATRNK